MGYVSHFSSSEIEEAMSCKKIGEPNEQWSQDKAHSFSNSFGVVDVDGARIPTLIVQFSVVNTPRLNISKFVFTLKKFSSGSPCRVYQQEINLQQKLKPGDHAYSHEHLGENRVEAEASWAYANFHDAVQRFCEKINLEFSSPLHEPTSFRLT